MNLTDCGMPNFWEYLKVAIVNYDFSLIGTILNKIFCD